MKKIKIYTAPICLECEKAKKYFKDQNIAFEEIDTFEQREEAEKAFKKAGFKKIPIIQIGETFLVGFDKKKIEEQLNV